MEQPQGGEARRGAVGEVVLPEGKGQADHAQNGGHREQEAGPLLAEQREELAAGGRTAVAVAIDGTAVGLVLLHEEEVSGGAEVRLGYLLAGFALLLFATAIHPRKDDSSRGMLAGVGGMDLVMLVIGSNIARAFGLFGALAIISVAWRMLLEGAIVDTGGAPRGAGPLLLGGFGEHFLAA